MNKLLRMLRYRAYRRAYMSPSTEQGIVDRFHSLYYELHHFGETWHNTFWLGAAARKCPLDLWVYQEIVHELRPDLIIETGTANGGSALFIASICDLLDHGSVITIDIQDKPDRPAHPRIQYLLGSSVEETILARVGEQVLQSQKVMVVLDSDHRKAHVLKELDAYSAFVTKGSYLIVEDTNLNGHPVHRDYGPGPMEAVEEFLRTNPNFVVDRTREKFRLTFNPRGYLRRER
jgi:cephalosporin hydroxylase